MLGDFGEVEVSICGADGVRKRLEGQDAPIESLQELSTADVDDVNADLQEVIEDESENWGPLA